MIADADVVPLVAPLARSAAVERFAVERRRERQASAAKSRQEKADADALLAKDAEIARRKAVAEADADWHEADADGCAAAARPGACEPLKEWLARNRTSDRVAEARAIVSEAAPRIRSLEDELFWSQVVPSRCERPTRSDDCALVGRYLLEHPTGAHAAEARRIVDGSKERIARLAEREALPAQEAAGRPAATASACANNCRTSVCVGKTGPELAGCMSVCAQRTCGH